MNQTRFVALAAWLAAIVTSHSTAATAAPATVKYTITDLGSLGGTYSEGIGLNGSGQVTGVSYTTSDTTLHAFLWTPTVPNGTSGTMHDLGTLGGSYSRGQGINAGGQVTGLSNLPGNTTDHAFLYDGTMHDLGTLGGTQSNGFGINASGQVTGQSETAGNAATHAFLYDGTMHDLGTLGGTFSFGFGINDSGQVTGDSTISGDLASHAFLYDGTMHDLGTLGGSYSSGAGVNASGQVAGSSSITGDLAFHAFLYDGTMHDLGTLGGTSSYGYAVNVNGHVVGHSLMTGDVAAHAFLYTSSGGTVDLNSLIDPLSGWSLEAAKAINDAGQIAGIGSIGGQAHAFLLTPVPEPSTAALVCCGMITAALIRHRKRL